MEIIVVQSTTKWYDLGWKEVRYLGWLKEWLPLIIFAYTLIKDFAKWLNGEKNKRRPRQGKRRM